MSAFTSLINFFGGGVSKAQWDAVRVRRAREYSSSRDKRLAKRAQRAERQKLVDQSLKNSSYPVFKQGTESEHSVRRLRAEKAISNPEELTSVEPNTSAAIQGEEDGSSDTVKELVSPNSGNQAEPIGKDALQTAWKIEIGRQILEGKILDGEKGRIGGELLSAGIEHLQARFHYYTPESKEDQKKWQDAAEGKDFNAIPISEFLEQAGKIRFWKQSLDTFFGDNDYRIVVTMRNGGFVLRTTEHVSNVERIKDGDGKIQTGEYRDQNRFTLLILQAHVAQKYGSLAAEQLWSPNSELDCLFREGGSLTPNLLKDILTEAEEIRLSGEIAESRWLHGELSFLPSANVVEVDKLNKFFEETLQNAWGRCVFEGPINASHLNDRDKAKKIEDMRTVLAFMDYLEAKLGGISDVSREVCDFIWKKHFDTKFREGAIELNAKSVNAIVQEAQDLRTVINSGWRKQPSEATEDFEAYIKQLQIEAGRDTSAYTGLIRKVVNTFWTEQKGSVGTDEETMSDNRAFAMGVVAYLTINYGYEVAAEIWNSKLQKAYCLGMRLGSDEILAVVKAAQDLHQGRLVEAEAMIKAYARFTLKDVLENQQDFELDSKNLKRMTQNFEMRAINYVRSTGAPLSAEKREEILRKCYVQVLVEMEVGDLWCDGKKNEANKALVKKLLEMLDEEGVSGRNWRDRLTSEVLEKIDQKIDQRIRADNWLNDASTLHQKRVAWRSEKPEERKRSIDRLDRTDAAKNGGFLTVSQRYEKLTKGQPVTQDTVIKDVLSVLRSCKDRPTDAVYDGMTWVSESGQAVRGLLLELKYADLIDELGLENWVLMYQMSDPALREQYLSAHQDSSFYFTSEAQTVGFFLAIAGLSLEIVNLRNAYQTNDAREAKVRVAMGHYHTRLMLLKVAKYLRENPCLLREGMKLPTPEKIRELEEGVKQAKEAYDAELLLNPRNFDRSNVLRASMGITTSSVSGIASFLFVFGSDPTWHPLTAPSFELMAAGNFLLDAQGALTLVVHAINTKRHIDLYQESRKARLRAESAMAYRKNFEDAVSRRVAESEGSLESEHDIGNESGDEDEPQKGEVRKVCDIHQQYLEFKKSKSWFGIKETPRRFISDDAVNDFNKSVVRSQEEGKHIFNVVMGFVKMVSSIACTASGIVMLAGAGGLFGGTLGSIIPFAGTIVGTILGGLISAAIAIFIAVVSAVFYKTFRYLSDRRKQNKLQEWQEAFVLQEGPKWKMMKDAGLTDEEAVKLAYHKVLRRDQDLAFDEMLRHFVDEAEKIHKVQQENASGKAVISENAEQAEEKNYSIIEMFKACYQPHSNEEAAKDEKKRVENELHGALIDRLTGVRNRDLLKKQFKEIVTAKS